MVAVVIMAGGRGLRLHPLTEKEPKPMLKVGARPMLETIINRYADQGVADFTLAVGYKADLISKYFGDGAGKGIRVSYLHEDEPLGTAGALKHYPIPKEPIIVANGDVMCRLDIADVLEWHEESGCMATMMVTTWLQQLPYGIVRLNGGFRVQNIDEKPILSHTVFAGIAVLSPEAFGFFPAEDNFDMPNFLLRLPSLAAYVLPDGMDWHDVGTFADYARASAAGGA
jgi:NDP-sugar pyrophosphorylase family protein